MQDDGERTEEPTPRKKRESREKGQVPKSVEVNTALVIIVGFLLLRFFGKGIFNRLTAIFEQLYSSSSTLGLNIDNVPHYVYTLSWELVGILAPIALGVMIIGVLANYVQVGYLFTLESIAPKPDRFNPIKGLKNLFSLKGLIQLFTSIIKILIIAYVTYSVIKGSLDKLINLAAMDIKESFYFTSKLSFEIGIKVGLIVFVLSVADYAYQRWEHNRNLKMTKQEVKEERKREEGDPLIKSRIRSIQREMSLRRMMNDVPEASVVVTNPTELAIAISYEFGTQDVPKVVAKGAGFVAQRIREIAKQHGVPIVQNKALAQILYRTVEIGELIPPELYKAVAEVLAYVYKLQGYNFG